MCICICVYLSLYMYTHNGYIYIYITLYHNTLFRHTMYCNTILIGIMSREYKQYSLMHYNTLFRHHFHEYAQSPY